jgi:transcriptional regulator with XRE-family HTH domain
MGFFDKLKEGLSKTRKGISEKIDQVLVSFGKVDDELFDELEEALITSDIGVETAMKIIEGIKKKVKEGKVTDPLKVKELLKAELVEILGWGKMTINRYERGTLPSKSHNDLLQLLINDEKLLNKKVDEAFKEKRISERIYEKLRGKFDSTNEHLIRSIIINKLSNTEDIFSGFRSFDLDRVENLISYIADKVELYKTSLNKYLWYIDFLNFNENVRSITGIRYVKAGYGPVIDNKGYELLINLLDDKFYKEEKETDYNCSTKIISKKNYEISMFTQKEMDIINRVIEKLKNKKCTAISNLTHKEEGWIKTDLYSPISYDYAEHIKLKI